MGWPLAQRTEFYLGKYLCIFYLNHPDWSASCKEDNPLRKSFCIFDPDHLDEPACCKDEGTKSVVFDVAPKSNCCSALKRIFTCCVWCCTTCNCCFVTQLIWIILLGGARCCQGGGNVRANSATPVLFNIARITFIFCSEILQEYFPLLVLWYCKNIFYLIICSV